MTRFKERLAGLGFASYAAYLQGDHWQQFKKTYRASGRPMTCAVCGGNPIQLHHHNYANLGAESVEDVTPLCRPHHEAVHTWLSENGKMVNATHKAVAILSGGVAPVSSKKPPVNRKVEQKYRRLLKRFNALVARGAKHPAVPPGYTPKPEERRLLSRYVKFLRRSLNPSWQTAAPPAPKVKIPKKGRKGARVSPLNSKHESQKAEATKALKVHRRSHEQQLLAFLTRPRR